MNLLKSPQLQVPVKMALKRLAENMCRKNIVWFLCISSNTGSSGGSDEDPIALEWEKRALCKMGIVAEELRGIDNPKCEGSTLFDFKARLQKFE